MSPFKSAKSPPRVFKAVNASPGPVKHCRCSKCGHEASAPTKDGRNRGTHRRCGGKWRPVWEDE